MEIETTTQKLPAIAKNDIHYKYSNSEVLMQGQTMTSIPTIHQEYMTEKSIPEPVIMHNDLSANEQEFDQRIQIINYLRTPTTVG